MNRRVRQWFCSLLMGMAVAMTPLCMIDSLAATAKIAFSDPTTKVGEEVSVTMKFTCTSGEALGNTDVMLAYDASVLEFINETENASGGSGAIRVWSGLEGKSEIVTTLRFKALQAGTANITVTSWEGYDNDGQALTVEKEGSSKITVAGLETSSNDATLKSLQVSPGTLEPAFTPATENYTVSVGLDTEDLVVGALANNDSATVAVEGGKGLAAGENKVTCRITAEDGTTTKTYTITVNKVEGGGVAAPETPDGTAAAEPEVLAELDVSAKKVQFLSLPAGVQVPDGFKESSIAIGDTRVQGWTWAADETPSYCVFYGRIGEGEPDFYRYDLTEKTVQKYFRDPAGEGATSEEYAKLAADYNSLLDDFRLRLYIMIGLGILAAILAAALIVTLVSGGKGKGDDSRRDSRTGNGGEGTSHASRGLKSKHLSKEERYMMGVEDEYEEIDDLEVTDPEAYMPEPVEPLPVKSKKAEPVTDVEAAIAANLAKEAAAAAVEPEETDFLDEEEDDFEFFDLDDK